MTNWFNAPYTGPSTSAGSSIYATYLEDSSTYKAMTYLQAYQSFLSATSLAVSVTPSLNVVGGNYGGMFLGCYAFQFGWIWQTTATWVSMLNWFPYTFNVASGGYDGQGSVLPGAWAQGNEQSEVVDTISAMFSGTYPQYRAPTINSALGIQVNGQSGPANINLLAGATYSASVTASDPGGLPLGYQWMVLPIPSGGPTDHTTYVPIGVTSSGLSNYPITSFDTLGNCVFQAPTTPGQYRLSVWVYNSQNRFATHNAPFTVSNMPSAYTFPVMADSYIQGPQSTGSTAVNYASANNLAGGNPILLGNSFANTKNIMYYPYLYFNFGAAAFPPTTSNLPTQVLLHIFSIGGQTSYYNLSVYPNNNPTVWNQNTLSFATLQTLAPTAYTYNAQYNWPYTPGFGGAANCPLATGLPPTVTACQPIVRLAQPGARWAHHPPDAAVPRARLRAEHDAGEWWHECVCVS